jgi:hypothetical protein
LNGDTGAPADVLVIGTLIHILKSAPAAHVIDKDRLEIRGAVLDVRNESFESVASPPRTM